MMISAGIDIGSRNTKLVLFDTNEHTILFEDYTSTEIAPLRSVETLYHRAFTQTGISESDISATCATGYGRHLLKGKASILTEISCHAAGIRFLFPTARTIIDIGGQDSKVILLNDTGKVRDFIMNDKCAAGTGRFLEMTAMRLGCSLDDLSQHAFEADKELHLSSTCVVFAESEIIGLMAENETAANISLAVNRSIAGKIVSQIASLPIEADIVFTGGVAFSENIRHCLSKELKSEILCPAKPETTGALGAAILAE